MLKKMLLRLFLPPMLAVMGLSIGSQVSAGLAVQEAVSPAVAAAYKGIFEPISLVFAIGALAALVWLAHQIMLYIQWTRGYAPVCSRCGGLAVQQNGRMKCMACGRLVSGWQ